MRALSVLGSTGSIGRQTLEVAAACGHRVLALTAHHNIALLEQQARTFHPILAAAADPTAAAALAMRLSDTDIRVLAGEEGVLAAARLPQADTAVTALVGIAGLAPTLAAIDSGKRIALANKETLVCAGPLVMARAREKGAKVGVFAATTTGEETTMRGAFHAAGRVRPTLAVAVDVIHASDFSGMPPQRFGRIKLGGGPALAKGSVCSAPLNRALEEAAGRLGIPLQYAVTPGVMGTDADKLNQTGAGLPVTTLFIPLRYMHSPSEVGSLADVEQTVEVLAEFLAALDEHFDPDPFRD